MLSESLIIGLVVLLLCGAVSFYMYIRLTFLEKKVGIMESILVDVRVALDSVMMEHQSQPPPLPISHTPGAQLSAPAPLDPSEAETIPEENFYSSVLEQAHEDDSEASEKAGGVTAGGVTAGVTAEGVTAEKALESFQEETAEPSSATSVGPNYDAMTRKELATMAEAKGLRVKRDMNRAEVLSLLRRSSPLQNDMNSTGAGNVSGASSSNQAGASLDGSTAVDLGKNGTELESSL